MKGVTVIIDAANVATAMDGTKTIFATRVLAAIEFFKSIQCQCVTFLPNFWVNIKPRDGASGNAAMETDNWDIFQQLLHSKDVTLTPSHAHDDYYIISYAMKHRGYVLTNDMFRDHIRKRIKFHGTVITHSWCKRHCIDYAFVGEEFVPNPVLLEKIRQQVIVAPPKEVSSHKTPLYSAENSYPTPNTTHESSMYRSGPGYAVQHEQTNVSISTQRFESNVMRDSMDHTTVRENHAVRRGVQYNSTAPPPPAFQSSLLRSISQEKSSESSSDEEIDHGMLLENEPRKVIQLDEVHQLHVPLSVAHALSSDAQLLKYVQDNSGTLIQVPREQSWSDAGMRPDTIASIAIYGSAEKCEVVLSLLTAYHRDHQENGSGAVLGVSSGAVSGMEID